MLVSFNFFTFCTFLHFFLSTCVQGFEDNSIPVRPQHFPVCPRVQPQGSNHDGFGKRILPHSERHELQSKHT
jgi:hypothetical protein